MSWIVDDTKKLKDYGFALEPYAVEQEGVEVWRLQVAPTDGVLQPIYLEVFEKDYDDDGELIEACHNIYIVNAWGVNDDADWEPALPVLAKLLDDGAIHWEPTLC